jgi:5-methylcytosine-specific restriction endonuclease McrA
MSLQRKTPMKQVRSKPRRKPTFTCSIRGCDTAPRYFPYCGKHARKEADRLFSLYIRARDRGCRMCTDRTNLQCAHLISRRYFAVRWEPENAVALCVGHHKQFTEDPLGWDDWCEGHLGSVGWTRLKLLARMGGMPDLAYVIAELRAMLKEVA